MGVNYSVLISGMIFVECAVKIYMHSKLTSLIKLKSHNMDDVEQIGWHSTAVACLSSGLAACSASCPNNVLRLLMLDSSGSPRCSWWRGCK